MGEISVMHNFQGYFSRTFQDLILDFQDFPGPGILKKKIPGLPRRHGNPEKLLVLVQYSVVFTGRCPT